MGDTHLSIDGVRVEIQEGMTILEAAGSAGIYIPALCSHPDLPPGKGTRPNEAVFRGKERFENASGEGFDEFAGCRLCLVEIEGVAELQTACNTTAQPGMVIETNTPRVQEERRRNLSSILAGHPHACLTCAQREGCTREPCSTNVPVEERCCIKFGNCELQKVAEYIGIPEETPRWVPTTIPILDGEPLFRRDYNLCIGCLRCVRACRELRGVEALGFVFDEKGGVIVGSLSPTLKESACRFCTACVEVCPTGALLDRETGADREAALVPCKAECPAGIDVPEYVHLVSQGRYSEAAAVVREKVPLPRVLGSICFHPCEASCRRGEVNEPVSIRALKRFAAENDRGLWRKRAGMAPPSGRSVAVVGGGPAGLTASFYLRKAGHEVVLYEAEDRLGGMMWLAIPEYRLPAGVLQQDLEEILESGIEVRTNTTVGDGVSLSELTGRHDAVFLAVGARLSRKLEIEGSKERGVLWGLDFLKEIKRGKAVEIGRKAVVIGGGNVAIDVALTARRLGAHEIHLACVEKREEMPAHEWECEDALAEGVLFHPEWGPKRILVDGDRVTGIELVRCTSVFDDQGRFSPSYDTGTTMTLEADAVILSIGQACDLSFLGGNGSIKTTGGGLIEVDRDSMETTARGVFAGGDAVAVPGSVIDAVASGRKAAAAIDRFLGGSGDIDEVLFERGRIDPRLGREEGFADVPRVAVPRLMPEERGRCFSPIDLGYDGEMAVREAKRCLRCDLRLTITPVTLPPERWLELNEDTVSGVPEAEGVYQLLDGNRNVLSIKGVANLRKALMEQLGSNQKATHFVFEEDRMYTQRESELIQQYLQRYGRLPEGGEDELDDLF
ncbi:MAG: FAD-dependent oxidoreductase [Deltaproteobacteria bacterium]|nr:FAD-dependent oxidoreductase [Deltaproteobacteria bacterium]